MESYPSIDREIIGGQAIYAFDKLDGSNIRALWRRKAGKWGEFCRFGTRNCLLDKSNQDFGEAIDLVMEKYNESLTNIFRKQQWEETICFFEYWSPNSFAGFHVKEPHSVTLIDIRVHKKGFLKPSDYVKLTKDLDTAKLLYYGNANEEFVNSVKTGKLENMTFEGVVCKGNEYVTPGRPLMFKIKNQAWLEKLKNKCKGDEKLFEKLS